MASAPQPEAPSVAEQPAPAAEPVQPQPASAAEIVWLDDELPAGAVLEGTWLWDGANFSSGKLSHGHPPAKGMQSHGCSFPAPVPVTVNRMITQQVWLDPNDPPKGIALQLRLASGEEVGVYWEGEEEVFRPQESQELWYYGSLPEFGSWTTLQVLAEDLGLNEGQVTGIRFVTCNGHVLWDRTVLTAAPPIEEAQDLVEGPVEVRPSLGKNE